MVKIRLRRTGAKKQPHYRVVVAESRSPRDGRFLETIGHYNPRTEPPTVEIDAERALYWLSVGAQPSEAVRRMLDKMGIMAQVPAVRKGETSIDQILAELALVKDEKAAKPEVSTAKVEVEVEAVAEEEFEPEEDVAEPDLEAYDEEDEDEEEEDEFEADEDDEGDDSEVWDEDEDDWDGEDSDDWDDDDADDVDDDQAEEDED
jgi:small subunit ribosomal protein S16